MTKPLFHSPPTGRVRGLTRHMLTVDDYQDIFADDSSLEKVAARTKLSSDTTSWGTDVLDAVYTELPIMREFEVDVNLDRIDDGTGTGLGKVLVYPTLMSKEQAAEDKRLVSMPIIIRNNELAPFDTYAHGEDLKPMDVDDLQSILHRPELFSGPMSARDEQRSSLLSTDPPERGDFGSGSSFTKVAGVGFWDTVRPTFASAAVGKLIGNKSIVRELAVACPSAVSSLADKEKVASATADVAQVRGGPGHYTLRRATRAGFDFEKVAEQRLTDAQVLRFVGARRDELHAKGFLTLVRDPVQDESHVFDKVAEVKEAGLYHVSRAGLPVPAFVFPQVVSLAGKATGRALVLGAEFYAEPEKVAGVMEGSAKDLPALPPRGRVIPVYWDGKMVLAYEPIQVTNTTVDPTKTATHHGTRLAGGSPLQFRLQEGLRKIAHIRDDLWAFPAPYAAADRGFTYLPCPTQARTLDAPATVGANFDLAGHDGLVKVAWDGTCYTLYGEPARGLPQGLTLDDTVFLLGVLGVDAARAEGLCKQAARTREPAIVRKTADLSPALEKVAHIGRLHFAAPTLQELIGKLFDATGTELWKTAEAKVAAETPSTLLALDFVTPENAMLYVNFLPDIEKSASQLAELLIASRLGYDDVRESAAKNAMGQVQEVVRGLRRLRDRVR